MNDSVLHCSDIVSHCGPQASREVFTLGFYDGPVKGVLKCSQCLTEYVFDMIDWDERDDGNDVRVFSLSPLPVGSFEKLVEIFPNEIGRKSQVWVPSMKEFSKSEEEAIRIAINEVIAKSELPELVMAWQGYWGESILAVNKLDQQNVAPLEQALKTPRRAQKIRDWFAFLGLERSINSTSS